MGSYPEPMGKLRLANRPLEGQPAQPPLPVVLAIACEVDGSEGARPPSCA